MEDKATKFDEKKIRPDLIPATTIQALGRVLRDGANKYSDRNWEKGLSWERIIGALERHLTAIKCGEDYDQDDGVLHAAHLLTNVTFLNEYYKTFPEGDRFERIIHPFYGKRIALDIDGVICNFNKSFAPLLGKSLSDANNWYYSYEANKVLDSLTYEFWLSLEPLFDSKTLCFEPTCYITHRKSTGAQAATEKWIEDNGFPCMPVLFVDEARDKSKFAKENEIDIVIDDKFKNFYRLNKDGVLCFLMDNPWNKKYNVGHLRIYHPNDIFKYRLTRENN